MVTYLQDFRDVDIVKRSEQTTLGESLVNKNILLPSYVRGSVSGFFNLQSRLFEIRLTLIWD